MKLKNLEESEIIPSSPFDFDSTFHKPDHFTSDDNYWEPGVRWQTFNFDGRLLGVVFKNAGTKDKPKIKITICSKERLPEDFINKFIGEVRYRYNLNLDLTDFYRKFKVDKTLGPIIKRWRGMRPGHPSSLYEYLIIGIVLQNATIKRSIQMLRALLENYGVRLEFDGQKLWSYWNPGGLKNVSEQDLRDLKVGYRAKSIKKIDEQFAEGLIDEMDLRRKDRETQMEKLLELYGVGPATVWYLLFDVFHHWDFFNHVSPWEQKIYSKLLFDRDPENPVDVKKLLKHFEKYGKYKQLAVHYIWEDLWWTRQHLHQTKTYGGQGRKNEKIDWLEKLIRL